MADDELLARSWVLWPDPRKGPWYVEAAWAEVDGIPECVGLTIMNGARPSQVTAKSSPEVVDFDRAYSRIGNGPAAITAVGVREMPVAGLVADLREKVRRQSTAYQKSARRIADEWLADAESEDERRAARALRRKADAQPFGPEARRRSLTPEHLRGVAFVYRRAVTKDQPPTKTVSEHFDVPYSTAAQWVATARKDGLLPPTQRGKPSRPGDTKRARRRT